MITRERFEELNSYFWQETNEAETQEWREELTAEEAELIDDWDEQNRLCMLRMCEKILENDRKRRERLAI